MGMNLSEELSWRGFVNQTTYPNLQELDKAPIKFYWGVDPSADSMTVGNLAAAMMVRTFIKHGHKPYLLVGGATGMIGDPDGKADERNLKSLPEINKNKKAIASQGLKLLGKGTKLVDNYDWFKDMHYLDFLREVGKHVPMRQMLAREFVQTRLGEGGSGISYAEFSYVLIQAYDFLQLYERHGVSLQVSGSDQWGNCIAGVDLIRRKTSGEAHVYSVPLITNQSTGVKFGKSEEGAIWLDPAKTTPTQFYQFWINTDDASVESYLKVFTELDKSAVEEAIKAHSSDPGKRHAQQVLAYQATAIVHGAKAADLAKEVTDYLIGVKHVESAGKAALQALRQEIPAVKAGSSDTVIDILVRSGLASSNSEARRLVKSSAVSINGSKVNDENGGWQGSRVLIRRGKAFKDSALIER